MSKSIFGFSVVFSALSYGATTIYYDDFDNADQASTVVGLGGDNPTVTSGLFGGNSAAAWYATTDGVWGSSGSKIAGTVNAFLPVSIPGSTSGVTYILSVDITTSASSGADWLAVGFASSTSGVFWDLGGPWALLRGQTTDGVGIGLGSLPNSGQAFSRNEENGANLVLGLANQPGPYSGTMRIVLDTSSSYWQVSWSFREEGSPTFLEFHSHQYSASDPNPNLTHVGIGAVGSGAGLVDNFSLTVVPEPSIAVIATIMSVVLCSRRRLSRCS